jgi:hypothetical protein
MRKASTALLEQGTQTPSPAPDLIPAEISTENSHRDWYSKRGHFTGPLQFDYWVTFTLALDLVCGVTVRTPRFTWDLMQKEKLTVLHLSADEVD